MKNFKIALAGNPNCGKTSVFNALTGTRQHVGNYPGVTVESKSGFIKLNDCKIEIIDLPGVYSISSGSPEEEVVLKELTTAGIDLIVNVVDSTILKRNLYFSTQLAELNIPMILVFNMSDDAEKKGLEYNIKVLEDFFSAKIVQTVGSKTSGVKPLVNALEEFIAAPFVHNFDKLTYDAQLEKSIEVISKEVDLLKGDKYNHIPSRFLAMKLLEDDSTLKGLNIFKSLLDKLENETEKLLENDINFGKEIANTRYASLSNLCNDAIKVKNLKESLISDKIDKVLTHKYWGLPIFFVILYLTFYFTFTCADPFMGYIEAFFGWLGELIGNVWNPNSMPFLRDLLIDGIIGGVGGVIVFLPNILFLFFAIAILEGTGYMARASFVMDGIMRKFGLQGRSFVPLVLGFGCTVPAIMATRTIESERDRTVTIMILPLFSCGARLPIYALIIPVFFAVQYQALMMWLIYIIGVLIALIAARLLKSTLFKGDNEVYLMELPPYRIPTIRSLLLQMWDRGKGYLQKAGTIILVTSVILYICNTYPEKKVLSTDYDIQIEQLENLQNSEEKIEQLENAKQAELMEYTVSGRVGKFLEPLAKPIGFDWKLTTASIGALAAKEIFVSQLGILYSAGEATEESLTLKEQILKNYTPLQGFCIMLFSLLSIPCLATLAIIKRELNSWKMAVVEAGGLLTLAYVVTCLVYQIGSII